MRAVAIIALLGIALTACSESSSGNRAMPTVPVHAEVVQQQDVPLYFESLGTLRSAEWIEIKPQVSGRLETVHFTEGHNVKKGDLLFSIDPQVYKIKLQEAEAQLAQDKAATEIARKKLERYQELSKKDLISQQEWDEMQSDLAVKEAQFHGDEARVAAAKLDLEHCSICSPIDGRTGKVLIHPGNLVADTQEGSLVTISNIEDLVIEFPLTEREFQQLKPEHLLGDFMIQVCSFADHCKTAKAHLTFLNNTFDEQTGLLHLQAKLENNNGQFLPGQHVKLRIPIQVLEGAKIISQKCVKINQKGPYVFLIKDDNTVEIRQVSLGDEIEEKVVVLDGLGTGDKVVTEGHLRLAPGMPVEIKTE